MKTNMNVKICLHTKVCMQNKILASTVQNLKRQNTSALVYAILKRWILDDKRTFPVSKAPALCISRQ